MQGYRSFAVAAALAVVIGCGGVNRAPNGERDGGGGANGVGDSKQPTPAERTGSTGDSGRGMLSLSDQDRQFVHKSSMSNQMEVTLGNLAEDKAQNDRVKQFGEQLARDHEAANRELQSSLGGGDATTARQTGNVAPASSDRDRAEQEQMDQVQQRLERVRGAEFDRAYLDEMVKHHEKDIQEFERAARSDNAQVRAFAERTLPTLRRHLEQAQQLQRSSHEGGSY
jgi:putative membrane protein